MDEDFTAPPNEEIFHQIDREANELLTVECEVKVGKTNLPHDRASTSCR